MVSNPYLFSAFNKHLLKMIMVQVIERSFQQQLSEFEYSLLNTCRSLVCWTGIFEYQLNTCEQEFGQEGGNLSSALIDAKLFGASVNNLDEQEKRLDSHLMQLCLVDVASGRNGNYVMTQADLQHPSAANVII